MENLFLFSAQVWVYACFLSPILLFFPIKTNNCISVVYHISYGKEYVLYFDSVHCRVLLRIPTWVCLYLIYSGQGLCWYRAINATNDPEFMK